MAALSDFLEHSSATVRTAAATLATLKAQLDAGTLGPSEYAELVADATNLDQVKALGADIERAEEIETALKLLAQVAAAVPLP